MHNKAKGVATKKEEVFGIFRPGGLSHTLNKETHFFEKIKIRIDNKQNKIFLFLFSILKFLISQIGRDRIKFRKFIHHRNLQHLFSVGLFAESKFLTRQSSH